MKIALQTLLVIFFLISFTVVLVTSTVKFELLNYNFLTTSFNKHNTYSKITEVVKNSINTQVGRGGGKARLAHRAQLVDAELRRIRGRSADTEARRVVGLGRRGDRRETHAEHGQQRGSHAAAAEARFDPLNGGRSCSHVNLLRMGAVQISPQY